MRLFPVIMLAVAIAGCKPADPFGSTPCIGRLRMIEAAKDQYRLDMLEQHRTPNDPATWDDIRRYMTREGKAIPKCPQGGTYTLGRLGEPSRCSISDHKLQ